MCVWAPGDAVTLRVAASSPSSFGKIYGSIVELHWGNGGPPQYVTVPAN